MGSRSKILQKITKNSKFLKKKLKKINIFLKNFWKFSKSKNRNFLKFIFGQKNYFGVLLRPNYIDLHSSLTQNWKKNFRFFWTYNFFQKLRKVCEQILWGSSPQNAHTDELKFDILLWPQSWSPLENRMNWKKNWMVQSYHQIQCPKGTAR